MSTASLAERIRMNQKSRSPVQDTVNKLYDQISEALAAGSSYRGLHVQLTREGHNVGKNHNSLFAAYQVVKRRRGNALRALTSTPGLKADATIAAGDQATAVADQMPTAIVDSRRKIDEW